MHGVILALAALVSSYPDTDVVVVDYRDFALPISVRPDRRDAIASIRIFVSSDQGKTWKLVRDCRPDDEEVPFMAPQDGTYWFAIQIISTKGEADPKDLRDLQPAQKVRVDTERRALKPQPMEEDLRREVETLRQRVAELEKRLADLEAKNKGK